MHDYYEDTEAAQGVPELDFNWDMYRGFEDAGTFVVYTARGKRLNGFAFYMVVQHPKYPSMMLAACDTLAVRTELRGIGIGRQIVEYAQDQLKRLGATHMTHNARAIYDTVPLFEKIGFTLFERVYMKELK
jgi:GNAT superfamily N-acetyltransferase